MKDGYCAGARTIERWIVAEVGLSNTQVWAAVLGEIKQRGRVPKTVVDAWLESAVLVGREGETLLLGVSATAGTFQLQPWQGELRRAIDAVIGASLPVRAVVA